MLYLLRMSFSDLKINVSNLYLQIPIEFSKKKNCILNLVARLFYNKFANKIVLFK